MQLFVYNKEGAPVEKIELPDSVFGLKWNAALVHQVVTSQQANQRSGTAHAKMRGEVRGGGKKPWRQKGTGRARHGSIRSPIWKGGGVSHGPRNEKDYHKKINKKMARLALLTALSAKARDGEIIILDALAFSEPKTRFGAELMSRMASVSGFSKLKRGNGVLVVLPQKDAQASRTLKNIPFVGLHEQRDLNAYSVLRYRYLLLPKEAVAGFEKK